MCKKGEALIADSKLAKLPRQCGAHATPPPHVAGESPPGGWGVGIKAGVASVNGGTFGSEPHLPFGGLRQSGTGWREAGTEALDVYSEWKTVYINYNPQGV